MAVLTFFSHAITLLTLAINEYMFRDIFVHTIAMSATYCSIRNVYSVAPGVLTLCLENFFE